ncbi:MAG: hypothetical protein S4CHLAM45_13290 [Chlamydiales bacterium]|nr:hypothetical protein [Chlamydiales bacterium]MCH9620599.1 hypothetical protein [Chlamydiales bacterium]MCH9623419.1 hypothetical protein [Chlamydiales bacterium]
MKNSFCPPIFLSILLGLASACTNQTQLSSKEPQLSDNQIVQVMLTVDKLEIDLSEETLKKDVVPPVAAYARYLIDQHHNSMVELTQLAKKLEIAPEESPLSDKLTADRKKIAASLEQLKGKELDDTFIDTMVKSHRAGLHLIDTVLLPEAKNTQLKDFIATFRAMVHNHLERALALQKTLSE